MCDQATRHRPAPDSLESVPVRARAGRQAGQPSRRSPRALRSSDARSCWPELGQLVDRLLGPDPGLGIPLADQGEHDLLDESRLAVGGLLVEAEVAGLHPEPGEAGGQRGHGQGLVVEVDVAGDQGRGQEPELDQLLEDGDVEAGGCGQLLVER